MSTRGIVEPNAIGETVIAVIKRGVVMWRVYYGDGLCVRSEDTAWTQCPWYNVQAVSVFRLSPRGDRLHCEDMQGLDEYRLEGHDRVKYGAWSSEYERITLAVATEIRRQFARPIKEVLGHGD